MPESLVCALAWWLLSGLLASLPGFVLPHEPLAPARYHLLQEAFLDVSSPLYPHTLSQLGSIPITRHDYAQFLPQGKGEEPEGQQL